MNPNKQQVCNGLEFEDDLLIEHTHVNPMTHTRDNARVVFSFVLEQVSLYRKLHNPPYLDFTPSIRGKSGFTYI